MRNVKRNITMYTHNFGTVDMQAGTVTKTSSIVSPKPMSKRDVSKYCSEHNCVILSVDEQDVFYSLPVELFVQACTRYAKTGTLDQTYDEYKDTDTMEVKEDLNNV